MLVNNFYLLFEGSLEAKLPTTWTDGKAEVAKVKEEKRRNKMQSTNPNAYTYGNGTDVKTHGYVVTQNTFLKHFSALLPVCSVEWKVWSVGWKVCKVRSVERKVWIG